ncbi:hypothetical protein [Heyndrickxia coagulans]|uniref:hypothetical protein n=1 Tax=Heyndrickxia coagulans TaxID=1398 RepID=UPI00030771BA|nr:hypothetical protein [Heyndrickxia coagulans]
MKQPPKTNDQTYRNPGTGAIEFAKKYVEGLTVKEALPAIERLLKGELHDPADKRIKRCTYCGYYYRDKTRPNNSKTCSRECKIANDTLKRAKKRADAALLKPEKERDIRKEMYTYHAYWLEYPYYISEHYMLRRAHNHERPFAPDKLAQIDAAKQRGYKRKGYARPTDGSDKVHVRGLRYKHSYSEVATTQMKRDEIDQYLTLKYGNKKLKMERWRAVKFATVKNEYIG